MTTSDQLPEPGHLPGPGAAIPATDLAVRWLGGSVVAASDEAFGDKENLVGAEPAAFEPARYGNRGQIVDGWETRRRRTPGHDWAIVRLGCPGTIDSVDVDTSFFTGNFPEACQLEACGRQGYPGVDELTGPDTEWREIVPRTSLRGDAHNTFPVSDPHRFTHVRLSIFPDGGVARLRTFGRVVPDPRLFDDVTVDLAAQEHGGRIIASSDAFYTSAAALIRPGRPRTMGEGWETRRRRDDGHDWVAIELAAEGLARQLVVDTTHFKYNASGSVAVYGTVAAAPPPPDSADWRPLLDRTPLQPDTRHVFLLRPSDEPVRAVRLDAFPDGGLARLRVIGEATADGRHELGLRWFNALTEREARACLAAEGARDPAAVVHARPLDARWSERAPTDFDEADIICLTRILRGAPSR